MKQQLPHNHGFTLLELIIVIIMVGILSLVATPVFFDLADDASAAAIDSVALTLGAASIRNYGIRQETTTQGSPISNCTQIANLISAWPTLYAAEYTITSTTISAGSTEQCSVSNSHGQSTQFTGHGIG